MGENTLRITFCLHETLLLICNFTLFYCFNPRFARVEKKQLTLVTYSLTFIGTRKGNVAKTCCLELIAREKRKPLNLVNVFIGKLISPPFIITTGQTKSQLLLLRQYLIFIYFAVKTTARRRQTTSNGSDDKAECLLFIPQGIISTAGDNNI